MVLTTANLIRWVMQVWDLSCSCALGSLGNDLLQVPPAVAVQENGYLCLSNPHLGLLAECWSKQLGSANSQLGECNSKDSFRQIHPNISKYIIRPIQLQGLKRESQIALKALLTMWRGSWMMVDLKHLTLLWLLVQCVFSDKCMFDSEPHSWPKQMKYGQIHLDEEKDCCCQRDSDVCSRNPRASWDSSPIQ